MKRLQAACGSLRCRVTLGTSIALVVGSLVMALCLPRQVEQDLLKAQGERQLGETVRVAAVLSRRVSELQHALASVGQLVGPETVKDDEALIALLESQPVLRSMFSSIGIFGSDGAIRMLADGPVVRRAGISIAGREEFRRLLDDRQPVISAVRASADDGRPILVLAHPLVGPRGVYGAIVGAVRLLDANPLADLVGAGSVDTGVLTVIADARGDILAHPDRARVQSDLQDDLLLGASFARWRRDGGGADGPRQAFDTDGALTCVAPVAGTDWFVWRTRSEAGVLAPLTAAVGKTLAWAVAINVSIAAAVLLMLGILLKPLHALEKRAQSLFDENRDPHDGWPDAGGEIGQLTRVLRHVGAQRAQLETFNRQVLAKLGLVMSAAPVGIAFTRRERFELVGDEFCRLLRRDESELLGQPERIIHSSNEDYFTLGPRVREAFEREGVYVGEWQMLRSDGTRFWAQLRGRPADADDIEAGAIWTMSDVTEHVLARERLEWSATHDALTGLANRAAFERRVEKALAGRPDTLPSELLMIDLDHFKPINDTAGHAAGDAMLKAVAAAIAASVRASDLVARYGGDEFAVLLERCSREVALRIASDVRNAVTAIQLPWEDRSLRVGASLGVAPLEAGTANTAGWLEAADAACYAAKAAGRNVVREAGRLPLRVVGE